MGLRAVNHIQQVLDGRLPGSAFADDVANACGGERNAIQNWLAKATQTNYAQLARIVLQHGESNEAARLILLEAGREVEIMANALDTTGTLPIALCGGLAAPLRPFMPVSMLKRIVLPQGDSAAGALRLIQQRLKE
jgi:glucosamine kinase